MYRNTVSYKRKIYKREKRDKILIVCEGAKTEPNYFKKFPVNNARLEVKIKGAGYNTVSLVKMASELKEKALADKKPYNQVWCVFDKDSFTDEQFNSAVLTANNHDIRVAYSNEAFELWYLLHYDYHDAAIRRNDYIKKLNEKIKPVKYKKNSEDMYKILIKNQAIAIDNAKKLLKKYKKFNPAKNNPSTTVYSLVEELNLYMEKI